MTLHAQMDYCVIPPPSFFSSLDFLMIPGCTVECSDIVAHVTQPPYSRSNTKSLNISTSEIQTLTDEASEHISMWQ